jgi:hypothetical protein
VPPEDPRALARDYPIPIIDSGDPHHPKIAFIATQDPTQAEREAIEQQPVMVQLRTQQKVRN